MWPSSCWLCGCLKVGPDFVKPEANVNPKWLEAGDYQQVTTRPDDYRDWWRSFHDPVLDDLIQSAYRQNLSLQIAGVRVLAARAQVGVAVGSLYPQTQKVYRHAAEESLQRERVLSPAPAPPRISGCPPSASAASWELDFWGKIRRAVESADASLMAAVSDYDNTLVTLTGDVANAYILLRTLEKRLAIAHQNVVVQKKSLQIATSRWKGGTTSLRDVEQAKTVLEGTEASIPTLESQVQQTQNALCVLMGLPPGNLTASWGPNPRSRRRRPRWRSAFPRTCCGGGRISRAPSGRPRPNAPRSAWPRPTSSRLSP